MAALELSMITVASSRIGKEKMGRKCVQKMLMKRQCPSSKGLDFDGPYLAKNYVIHRESEAAPGGAGQRFANGRIARKYQGCLCNQIVDTMFQYEST